MKAFSKSKVLIFILALTLALAVTACTPTGEVDTSPTATMDNSPLSTTAGAPTTGSPSASPAVTGGAQTPDASPSPSQPTQAIIPAATNFAPLDPGYEFAQNLAAMYKNCDYAIIATIEEELGARNIMEGTDLGKTLPNAVLNQWEYKIKVTEVFKSASDAPITVNSEIVLSQPFEIKMKSSEPLSREEPFIQLEVGQSYVLLLSFEDYYKVYNPSSTEPNIMLIEGDNLRYISGVESYLDLWKNLNGSDTITMNAFRDVAK